MDFIEIHGHHENQQISLLKSADFIEIKLKNLQISCGFSGFRKFMDFIEICRFHQPNYIRFWPGIKYGLSCSSANTPAMKDQTGFFSRYRSEAFENQ